jgi:hypothetical protein
MYDYMEPIAFWTKTAGQFSSILSAAKILRDGDLLDSSLVKECYPGVTGVTLRNMPNWQQAWDYLIGIVETLKANVKIQATLISPPRKGRPPVLCFVREEGLYGFLVWEMSRVLGIGEFAHCSGCGRQFVPTRHPRKDRRIYCLDCRNRKVPFRDAQRDYRTRQKDAQTHKGH